MNLAKSLDSRGLVVPAANNSDDLTRFAALSKYFRGEHHLEEMMFHENCPRSTLLQLVDKFRAVLIKHEHEDIHIIQRI